MRKFLPLVLALLWGFPAWGQPLPAASNAVACLAAAASPAPAGNQFAVLSCDTSGALRVTLTGAPATQMTATVPTTSAGPTPVVGTTSALVVRNAPANLYGFSITAGGTATYLAIVNATAVPAGGAAIAPLECIPVPVNGYVARRQVIPDRFTTGVVFLSTSSCTTYTAVAPQVMSGVFQ